MLLTTPPLPANEARALLAMALHTSREHLIAHPELPVSPAVHTAYETLVARRQSGEPMAYLLGEKEFYGRPFRVTPDVLVPRPDTETLVEVALTCLRGHTAPRLLDLGTGSGCVAITLKLERPDAAVTATDVSTAALAVARSNAESLKAEVSFLQSDWFVALAPRTTFDLIVSNPPYVAATDPHLAALSHEPGLALTDGSDGLQCLSVLIEGACAHLPVGGWLVLEHGYDQSAAVSQQMRDAGYQEVAVYRDAGGQTRVAAGHI
ncbi:MAG: peptide chain release factor N(5)-glutamine methyltransferase [Betaproteobacteria bacterium]